MRLNLISEREKSGYTKNTISQRLGITIRQYDRIEAGTSAGRVEYWEILYKFFGGKTPLDKLMENIPKEKIS